MIGFGHIRTLPLHSITIGIGQMAKVYIENLWGLVIHNAESL